MHSAGRGVSQFPVRQHVRSESTRELRQTFSIAAGSPALLALLAPPPPCPSPAANVSGLPRCRLAWHPQSEPRPSDVPRPPRLLGGPSRISLASRRKPLCLGVSVHVEVHFAFRTLSDFSGPPTKGFNTFLQLTTASVLRVHHYACTSAVSLR